MAEASVRIVFTGDAGSATRAVKGLEGSFLSLGRIAKTALAIGGGVMIARGLREAGKAAIEFEAGMRNVNSLAKLTEPQFRKLSAEVLKLAGPTGQAPKVLADGLYDIVSSGIKAGDAVGVLREAAVAATAGLTDTGTAANALVAALNAWELPATQAKNVSSALFEIVNRGVITFEELAQNMGDLTGLAPDLGISLAEVGGALASLTLKGGPAAENATRIKGVMLGLFKPTEDLTKVINELGFENAEALIKAKGFGDGLQLIREKADDLGIAISDLIPDSRGLQGFLKLSGDNAQNTAKLIDQVTAAYKRGNAQTAAFAEQSKSLAVQWQKAKAALAAAAIPIAQLLFPALVKGAQALADFAGKVSAVAPQIKAGFAGFVDPINTAFTGLVDLFRSVGSTLNQAFSGAGIGSLGGLFKDAATAGRTLGTGLVVLVGALGTYKAAMAAATAATRVFDAVTTKSLVGLAAKVGIMAGGAIASWFGLKAATDNATAAAAQAAPTWQRAAEAVQQYQNAALAAQPAQAQLRDATLAVERAQLTVAQALAYRSQVEAQAGKGSLEYAAAQQSVREAYAALDNAERNRATTLESTTRATAEAKQANRAFISTLMEQVNVTSRTTAAQQRQYVELGAFRTMVESFAAVARDGTPRMRMFTAATLALGEQLGRMPSKTEVEIALEDAKFRPALLRALRDLDLLSTKDVKTKVDIQILAKDALEDVNKKLDEAKAKKANPKVIVELKNAKADLEDLLKQLANADKKKAKPKLEVLKGQFFNVLERATSAISDLDSEKAKPKIEIDPYPALSAITGVQSALRGLTDIRRTITYTYRVVGSPPRRAGGGFIPGQDSGGRDSVLTFLAPGEVVLNRSQQQAFGGPQVFKRMFGFDTAGVPGMAGGGFVQPLAAGGFVSASQAGKALQSIIRRDKKNSGYKAKSKAVAQLAKRLDGNRTRQDNLARSIGQDSRESDISVEEFIRVDADGNETLDTGAVAQRVAEIDRLVGRYNELLGLVDEETAILKNLIQALEAAIKAWQAEIRDQERVIRETTALIKDATAKMNAATDQGVKSSYQQVIDRATRTRDNARSKIEELRGNISQARDDRGGYQKERGAQQYDRRDVELDMKELEQEKRETQAVRARPPEPTSAADESAAASAGADGFGGPGGDTGAGTTDPDQQALIDALKRMVAQLKLALGLERVQMPVIGSYQRGTLQVPQTGPYMLHGGEQVVPAGIRPKGHDGASLPEIKVTVNVANGMEWLERFVDVHVEAGAGRISRRIGREADRMGRAGEAGLLTTGTRRV